MAACLPRDEPPAYGMKDPESRGAAAENSPRRHWYQKEPHAAFPPLPPVEERIPKFKPTGGPGQDPKMK
jgi:hypothetical protein